eukprot:g5784.t1
MMKRHRPRRRTQSNHGGSKGRGGGGGALARLRHQATLSFFALFVLHGSYFSDSCGVAGALPPSMDTPAGTDRALDAAAETDPEVEVTLDEGGRSMTESETAPVEMFSPEWEVEYHSGKPGCELARGSYMWRVQGLGSNINNLLNAWVYALAVEGWKDLSVIIDDGQMAHVECGYRSPGKRTPKGWECLFQPMPHLCTFGTELNWEIHMVTNHLDRSDLAEAARLDQDAVRFHPEEIEAALEGSGTDHLGAKAAMAKYLWSNMTPWLKADIDIVARAPKSRVFETSPFLALHVRRGDKILREAQLHVCEEYLSAAVAYLEGQESQLNVEDIRGIWVASDDSGVVDRIKEIAPSYLPNVDNSTIFWASGGVEGGPDISQTQTRTDKETYGGFVYTFADLHQCTQADVFVGTFSSNLGRLLVLLRESIGLKQRHSAISLDGPWWAGRRRR